jgi:hypothetical protein
MVRSEDREALQGGRGITRTSWGSAPSSDVRLPAARANAWLLLANARYWLTVAPLARSQLRDWERRARSIGDRRLRRVALEKLGREGFNAEAAATLAVFAPVRYRADVAKTIVALEVLYDYLDGLAAELKGDRSQQARTLFEPFTGAFAEAVGDAPRAGDTDDGYTSLLSETVRRGLARLPATAPLLPTMRQAARRTAEGQLRSHAIGARGRAQLEDWARRAALGSELAWPEFAAGAAASVLALHALIASASRAGTTAAQAREIDDAYLMISAVSTMLDSVNDYERDRATERPIATAWYDDDSVAGRISSLASRSLARTARLRHGPRHVMIGAGVIAYYTSPPEAASPRAREVAKQVHRELRALTWPTLAVMRSWRMMKRVRAWIRAPTHASRRTDRSGRVASREGPRSRPQSVG